MDPSVWELAMKIMWAGIVIVVLSVLLIGIGIGLIL